ncbi:F-box/LRR-repeat protein 2-like [Limulus polyphemus]|uniref:F-box/LRR-repeat protein 2-like n=1 Tax=Limulus polyphemus TaxID=6850 RepID=A0ABM1SZT3_LIMPO|nr:F-box/LRR-repeat protein 2-like [Limulus polyphemus]
MEKVACSMFSERRLRTKQIQTIDKLPDKVILKIFSYLPHKDYGCLSRVCKKWRRISSDSRLWTNVSLRPHVSGLHVTNYESLLALISIRFGPSLKSIELPIELITNNVLHELATKCSNLTTMLLDFSTAMQLHDFSRLHKFPSKLRSLCICLSDVIFMDGFMRKIYSFLTSLEVLHLIGTYEHVEEEDEEGYDVINIHKLKQAVPHLRVVNLYGITFLDDSHVESLSSMCVLLECLALNFCSKFTGSVFDVLFSRCTKLKSLLLQQTGLKDEHVMLVEWNQTHIQELDITGTDLSSECLIILLTRIPALRYLSAGQQDGFTDEVLCTWLDKGNCKSIIALDLDGNESLTGEILKLFIQRHGVCLRGLVLSGISSLNDQFWLSVLRFLPKLRILSMGTPLGCCKKIQQKIHTDTLLYSLANNCPLLERLEIGWDDLNLMYSDRSSKAVDALRVRCLRLRCLTLSDNDYCELVKANYERAERPSVVRTTTSYRVNLVYLLMYYSDLMFN